MIHSDKFLVLAKGLGYMVVCATCNTEIAHHEGVRLSFLVSEAEAHWNQVHAPKKEER